MYKLDLEKAGGPEIKLPTFAESWKKQGNSKKTSANASSTMLKPFTIRIMENCGKFFKGWEYQTPLPVSWETCMQVKNQQLEPDMTIGLVQTWERSTSSLYIVSLLNWYAEYILQNVRMDDSQAGIKIAGRNIDNLCYTGDTTLVRESEEDLKSLLKVNEESEKAGLKLNIQNMKIMASDPILHGK